MIYNFLFIILFIAPLNACAVETESNYYQLQQKKCNLEYLFNKALHKNEPLYLKAQKIMINDEYISMKAFPTIIRSLQINSSYRQYFYRDDNVIKLIPNQNKNKKKFFFYIRIYGIIIPDKNKLTAHIYGLQKINGHWKGYIKDLKVVLKYRRFCLFIKNMKWLKTSRGYELAILCQIPKYEELKLKRPDHQFNSCEKLKCSLSKLESILLENSTYINAYCCTPYHVNKYTNDQEFYTIDKKNGELSKTQLKSKRYHIKIYVYSSYKKVNKIKVDQNECNKGFSNIRFSPDFSDSPNLHLYSDQQWIDNKSDNILLMDSLAIKVSTGLSSQSDYNNTGMTITHKNGIGIISNIYHEDTDFTQYFTIKSDPNSDFSSNIMITPAGNYAIPTGLQLKLQIKLTNPRQTKYFCCQFKPAEEVNLEKLECPLENVTRQLKIIDQKGKPINTAQFFRCVNNNCSTNLEKIPDVTYGGKLNIPEYFPHTFMLHYKGCSNYNEHFETIYPTTSSIELKWKSKSIYFQIVDNEKNNITDKASLFISEIKAEKSIDDMSGETKSLLLSTLSIEKISDVLQRDCRLEIEGKKYYEGKIKTIKIQGKGDSEISPYILKVKYSNIQSSLKKRKIFMLYRGKKIQDISFSLFTKDGFFIKKFNSKENGIVDHLIDKSGTIKVHSSGMYCEKEHTFTNQPNNLSIELEKANKDLLFSVKNFEGDYLDNSEVKINFNNNSYFSEYDMTTHLHSIKLQICTDEIFDIKITARNYKTKELKSVKFSILSFNKPKVYKLIKEKPKFTKYKVNITPSFIKKEMKETATEYDSQIFVEIKCNKKAKIINIKKAIIEPTVECSDQIMHLTITSKKFELYTGQIDLKEYNNTKSIIEEPELFLKKPGLYLLINPSDDFKKGYLKKLTNSFATFKEVLLTQIVKNNYSKTSILNIISKNYNKKPDIIFENFSEFNWEVFKKSDKWKSLPSKIFEDVMIFNESIDINTLMEDSFSFFNLNNYSFPQHNKKGIILLILSDAPKYNLSQISDKDESKYGKLQHTKRIEQLKQLNLKLKKRNIGALLVFIGTGDKLLKEYSNLICIKYNFKNENQSKFSILIKEVQNKIERLLY